ncbi:MAG: FAD-dependent oxidoreductase, partial [Proteobacteria bacterium]|nr:FAD-dependent oxidoreductase [Pseudomonadota bacterium]
ADEGDPGAYMDRSVLEGDPHSVLEGLTIAARATGATHGYIYARHEYPLAVQRLLKAIALATDRGLLGQGIFGTDFDFDITISTGAGAFVCGEETALMAAIMGDPGRPRPRPPFPAQSGLWGRPSNINNVETMANVPAIVYKGAEWYAGIGGGNGSSGTKVFSLVGKINNTGLVEVPIGTTLGRIVYDIGGGVPQKKRFKAVQTGGPSGGCIPQQFLDTPVDYETLGQLGAIMGSGGMIVMDQSTCMVDLGRFFIEFLMEESCGKCVPCREGLLSLHEVLGRICVGEGALADLDRLRDVGQAMKDFSLCGLGQTAPNPVLSTLRYFEDEFLAHIQDKRCPAGVCRGLVVSPCQNACPAGVDVPNYVALAAEGKYRESWAVVCERNPFPAVCGRICSHPCEGSCRRGELDQPVAIKDIKRVVTDWAWEHESLDLEPFPVSRPEKMAVVGAGPAGLTCAYYLRQMGYEAVVFEAADKAGGMLRLALPPFRLPPEVVDREIERIVARGVEIRLDQPLGEERRPEDLLDQGYAAVFVGTGAPRPMRLDIPGADEGVEGFLYGLDFLRRICRGEELRLAGKVAVIGGGNVALDAARSALRLGADEVTLYYRREREDMPSSAAEIEEAEQEGVGFHFRAWPDRVVTQGGRVRGMVFAATECGQWDAQGRRAFERIEGME